MQNIKSKCYYPKSKAVTGIGIGKYKNLLNKMANRCQISSYYDINAAKHLLSVELNKLLKVYIQAAHIVPCYNLFIELDKNNLFFKLQYFSQNLISYSH